MLFMLQSGGPTVMVTSRQFASIHIFFLPLLSLDVHYLLVSSRSWRRRDAAMARCTAGDDPLPPPLLPLGRRTGLAR